VAISLLQETAAATARLPRFARNDSSTETGYAWGLDAGWRARWWRSVDGVPM